MVLRFDADRCDAEVARTEAERASDVLRCHF
jgi:hypothetical protein